MNLRLALFAPAAASAAFMLGAALPAGAQAQIGVTINGNAVNVSPAPIDQDGRVFVPLRSVFEQLGASVVYDNGAIDAQGNGRDISLRIGSTQASVNGQPATLDVAPFIVGESTYVPLRFISESLGASVDWDDANDVVAINLSGAPTNQTSNQNYGDEDYGGESQYADQAPPPIPDYDQPPVPAPDEIWQPGFWQWGPNGYYWVPGTWVQPPQTGYLWTPGYWRAANNRFVWNAGYWAISVGFYGGINYGAGYFGNGYNGGRWSNNTFQYNTYVTHVNTTIVRNVYVDRTVIVNAPTHVSYNGGPHGIPAQPTQQQIAVGREHHVAMTPVQQQHVRAAASDRQFLASVNHNQPPVAAVARPLSTTNRPVGYAPVVPADRVASPAYHAPAAAPAERIAPAYHAPVAAPAEHVAPAYHAPAAAPVQRAAPAYHAPVAAPAEHVAPAYHAPAAAPVQHAAPVYPAPAAAAAGRVAPPKPAPHPRPSDDVRRG